MKSFWNLTYFRDCFTILLEGGGVALFISKENLWDFSFLFHICAVSYNINYLMGALAEHLLSFLCKGKYPMKELAEF